jgi:hypothetical protein
MGDCLETVRGLGYRMSRMDKNDPSDRGLIR